MVPDSVRVFLGILFLAGLVVGVAWVIALNNEIPTGEAGDGDTTGYTLVEFPTQSVALPTEILDIPESGTVSFQLNVPYRNVTSVAVTLRVEVAGPSANDQFSIEIVAPDGDQRTGSYTGPPTALGGMNVSPPIVESWARALQPPKQRYDTSDQQQALNWAARNHTDTQSVGTWTATLTMNPPPVALRSANASLLFTYSFYDALAFPEPRIVVEDTQPDNTTDDGNGTRAFALPAPRQAPPLPALRLALSTAQPIRS